MKTVRLYLVPFILILSSIYCIVNSVKITKDAELAKAGIKLDEAKIEKKVISSYDMITVKHIIESYASSKSLPLSIDLDKNIVKIGPDKNFNTDVSITSKTILMNYEKTMDFLAALSSMPYQMEYKTFCLGTECSNGLDATIEVKAIASN